MRRVILSLLLLALLVSAPATAKPADPGIPVTVGYVYTSQGPPAAAFVVDLADYPAPLYWGNTLAVTFDGGAVCTATIYLNGATPPGSVPATVNGLRLGTTWRLLTFPPGPLPCYLGLPNTARTAREDPAGQTLTIPLP